MAKAVSTDTLDGALNVIKNNVVKMTLCTTQPATYADANTTLKLAEYTMATGDFTLAAGDTNGRKVTVAAKTGAVASASGSAAHVALLDGTRLLLVTTVTSQTVTSGNTVNIGTWKYEINNPV
jgi:hypothetical protein